MSARFDQHFLVDRKAIERIAGIIRVEGRTVLEVGPGRGALTEALLERGARVVAVEIDPGLVEMLSERFLREIGENRLVVVHGDAVSCPLPGFDVVVSNLPYSASSKITFRLLETGFEEAVLMYQSEFADRMLAPAGTPECGRLSVMVQTYCAVGRVFDVPPQAFSPRPKVRSTVLHIVPREPLFPIRDRDLYARVVRALFSHRRKTVRNSLKSAGSMLESGLAEFLVKNLPEEILAARPEELYLEDFATIANMGAS
ncbi:MAG TPA: 16S rRNA (adenine(1518)-N(6)/adenine(1519)-N(6))-dimethyltransferase RsmA [Methanolinea sp.]|nr:16S rRNA (adenine(1518)-N(6)/adenine(1519)-N(6))-dimethyltransferase RsmA [Methanolinea sp.]HQE84992.1 16S rRNA (adenine(1518)-N(6)/adenine(1519)-N(6))-dimethyltransferase RsmA [Methanolinea sp.]HQI14094.1 16S rRNA (adenine(1518)-N(6)/adenine(1519)-N(6))-dimethyltransferase RsmA [Methanolinea sp.]HQJ18253.1 16S rRNA (adenine(1518)-N(6)/adenine(1519)-N(6))-dimethyltransferase RsmA [Methanolinea sp.]